MSAHLTRGRATQRNAAGTSAMQLAVIRRAFPILFALVMSVSHSAPAAEPTPTPRHVRRSGFEARTGLELSVIETRSEFLISDVVNADPDNFEVIEMPIPDRVVFAATGPRLEIGYFFALANGLGLYPRVAGSWASSIFTQRSEELSGRTYRYRQTHHYWDVTLGGEFLLIGGRLGIALDYGLAQVRPQPRALEPDDLRTVGREVGGAQLRVGLSYHTPLTPYLGLGATLFAARLTYPELSDDPGTLSTHRFGLGVLLEWGPR